MEQQPLHSRQNIERDKVLEEPIHHEKGPEDDAYPETWISPIFADREANIKQETETAVNTITPMETLLSGRGFEKIMDPKLVIAVLEPKCNLKCEHCYWNHEIDYGKRANKWENQIRQIINWDADVAYAGRVLTPRSARFIKEYCERSGKKIGIVDNGYTILTRPELYRFYDYVDISLDGIPEDHDRQRNQKGSFDIAWNAIIELRNTSEQQKNEDLYPVVASTFSPINIDHWERFEKLLINEHIPMSCNPVLGVQENYDRNMPLFDSDGICDAFEKVVSGMPKLINLYDPRHVEALLPQLKKFKWNIRENGDALKAQIERNTGIYTTIIYKPLSVQTFGERTLLWTGNFHADADVADANFTETATDEHLLSVANRFASQEIHLVRELLEK